MRLAFVALIAISFASLLDRQALDVNPRRFWARRDTTFIIDYRVIIEILVN